MSSVDFLLNNFETLNEAYHKALDRAETAEARVKELELAIHIAISDIKNDKFGNLFNILAKARQGKRETKE